ncbi:MAG: Gp49 family protein [Pseudomonadota bacterium]
MSLQETDAESASFAVAPRVSLADIEAAIKARVDLNAGTMHDAVFGGQLGKGDPLRLLSICILTMRNGFTVIGNAAPASPENFNAEYGKKLAYEDAIRQLWPLMGFALRERLAAS